ncbi:MAG: 50S ribosomal protein L21 [Holosporales bacterium]|jgi:large subunit ribosomal protein L21|nr:50S ribosomal protein L21 [Holosporales bacterium]
MFAIVKTGGKQYRVSPGDILAVEKMEAAREGDVVELSEVLAISRADGELALGAKISAEAVVRAEVLKLFKDKKVLVFKKKRRHNYRRKVGHRQQLCLLKVKEVVVDAATVFSIPIQLLRKTTAAVVEAGKDGASEGGEAGIGIQEQVVVQSPAEDIQAAAVADKEQDEATEGTKNGN